LPRRYAPRNDKKRKTAHNGKYKNKERGANSRGFKDLLKACLAITGERWAIVDEATELIVSLKKG